MANKEKGPFKYHSVFRGRQVGIYSNWGKAKESIHKFPNSSNKGFNNLTMAIEAMKDIGISNPIFYGKCPSEAKCVKIDEESHLLLSQSYQSSDEMLTDSNISVSPRLLVHSPEEIPDQSDSNIHDLESSDCEIFMRDIFTENNTMTSRPFYDNIQNHEDLEITVPKSIDSPIHIASSHVSAPTTDNYNIANLNQNVINPSGIAEDKPNAGNRRDEDRKVVNENCIETNMIKDILNKVLKNQQEIKTQNENYQQKQTSDIEKTFEYMETLKEENRSLSSSLNNMKSKLEALEQNQKLLHEKLELSHNEQNNWQNLYKQLTEKYDELVDTVQKSENQTNQISVKIDKQDEVLGLCNENILKMTKELTYKPLSPELPETKRKMPINVPIHHSITHFQTSVTTDNISQTHASPNKTAKKTNPSKCTSSTSVTSADSDDYFFDKSSLHSERKRQDHNFLQKNSLRLAETCTHILMGDSNMKNVQRRKLDRSGNTEVRTYRGAGIKTLTGIVNKCECQYKQVTKVSVCIGTNDCSRRIIDADHIVQDFDTLITALQKVFPNASICILAIPPQRNPKANVYILEINRALKKSVPRNGVIFQPCDSMWYHVQKSGDVDMGILQDNVHLSDYGLSILLKYVISFFYRSNNLRRSPPQSTLIINKNSQEDEKINPSHFNMYKEKLGKSKLVTQFKEKCLHFWNRCTEK